MIIQVVLGDVHLWTHTGHKGTNSIRQEAQATADSELMSVTWGGGATVVACCSQDCCITLHYTCTGHRPTFIWASQTRLCACAGQLYSSAARDWCFARQGPARTVWLLCLLHTISSPPHRHFVHELWCNVVISNDVVEGPGLPTAQTAISNVSLVTKDIAYNTNIQRHTRCKHCQSIDEDCTTEY